jgi:hypothetical protein
VLVVRSLFLKFFSLLTKFESKVLCKKLYKTVDRRWWLVR